MKLIKTAIAGVVVAFAIAMPATANAANEMLDGSFSLKPQSGQFLNNGFKPANWAVENTVTVPPGTPEILPSKVIDIGNPKGEVTFNPGKMPVCPDTEVGPQTRPGEAPNGNKSLSEPVPVVVARCPNSVLGNGTAQFAFSRIPAALLDGVMVAFNGGLNNKGRPVVKVYAFSYDTQIGIYTEAIYQKDGKLVFNVPQLTADSSVTTLNLAIPGKQETLNNWGPGMETVILPKGKKADYVQARCSTGEWPWTTRFTHGTRDTDDTPTSPDTFSSTSGVETCTGVTGKAKIGSVQIQGPSKARVGKTTTYRVKIRNSSKVVAQGVRVRVSGRGVKVNAPAANIQPGKTRTVRFNARFTRKGNVKATFRVTANNANTKTVRRTIRVR